MKKTKIIKPILLTLSWIASILLLILLKDVDYEIVHILLIPVMGWAVTGFMPSIAFFIDWYFTRDINKYIKDTIEGIKEEIIDLQDEIQGLEKELSDYEKELK